MSLWLIDFSDTCHLNFSPMSTELEYSFNRVTVQNEDEDVEKKQWEEDLQLYGSRPDPPEVVDVDEAMQLANLSPKRSASEFEAAVDRPAKARRTGESKDVNDQAITAMDWNSGASPLDAWLNQSAAPLAVPRQDQEQQSRHEDPAATEREEIKVFRNVHIADAPEPTTRKAFSDIADEIVGLGLQAQIYYRNIVDRYPLLPAYLARRLAIANHHRAERLKHQRTQAKKPLDSHENMHQILSLQDHNATMDSGVGASLQLEKSWAFSDPIQPLQQQPTTAQLNSKLSTGTEKEYKCKICDKMFWRLTSFHNHMFIHDRGKRELSEKPPFRNIVLIKLQDLFAT